MWNIAQEADRLPRVRRTRLRRAAVVPGLWDPGRRRERRESSREELGDEHPRGEEHGFDRLDLVGRGPEEPAGAELGRPNNGRRRTVVAPAQAG